MIHIQLFQCNETSNNGFSHMCVWQGKQQHLRKLYSDSYLAIHCTKDAFCKLFSLFLQSAPSATIS